MTDLLGEQVSMIFETIPAALGYIPGRKLKALRVTGAKRKRGTNWSRPRRC